MMTRLLVLMASVMFLAGCGQGNVFSLQVGDCFFEPSGVEIFDVTKTDCSEPHDSEMYARFDLEGDGYPGRSTVEAAAIDRCPELFGPYVGRDYATSRLSVWWLGPTSESWSDGDREIACILSEFDGSDFTGSMKGSGV